MLKKKGRKSSCHIKQREVKIFVSLSRIRNFEFQSFKRNTCVLILKLHLCEIVLLWISFVEDKEEMLNWWTWLVISGSMHGWMKCHYTFSQTQGSLNWNNGKIIFGMQIYLLLIYLSKNDLLSTYPMPSTVIQLNSFLQVSMLLFPYISASPPLSPCP